MNDVKNRIRTICRSSLRPIAQMVRSALTPPAIPIEFDWHEIHGGPAKGCHAILPGKTVIAEMITSGNYDPVCTKLIRELVGSGDNCLDIGGHYGYFTLSLAKLCEPGQVHTFDPVVSHADRIRQAADRSGLVNVTVHQVAVAAESGVMTLRYADSGGDDSMAYLELYGGVDSDAAREHYDGFATTQVRTVTLDEIDVPMPRFIKIDAEGAEVHIIRGGVKMLAETKPRLLIELHGITEALQAAEILMDLNYQALLLSEQKTTLPVLWVHRDDSEAVECVQRALGHAPTLIFDRAGNRR